MNATTPGRGSPSIPAPPSPGTTTGRRVAGSSADGRRWELLADSTRVAAVTSAGTVADAHVSERDDLVVVEFWANGTDLPHELCTELVRQAFTLPAVRGDRAVLVCVPRRNGEVIADARRHVRDARTRAAGVTCLMEGLVQAGAPGSGGDPEPPPEHVREG
ncbi:MAG TPA: hypothetical protein VGN47_15010 [Blastococcus sp.]|jgi:hypothetical protein|nr:hypothetical protein [Blastococcus sp.]